MKSNFFDYITKKPINNNVELIIERINDGFYIMDLNDNIIIDITLSVKPKILYNFKFQSTKPKILLTI